MALHAVAFAPDEHVLLTLDERELLAHDAQTESPKWRVTFDHPLVAVIFADAGALPVEVGGSPWRAPASGRHIVAVDAEGVLHAIEPMLGEQLGKLGPFGRPSGIAAGTGGVIALALQDRVLLWRSRERTEIAGRASAIAFSNDGGTLAIGARDGGLRFMSIRAAEPPVETFCAVVHGGITDVVQHPGGTWIAAGKSGVSAVTSTGPRRLDALPADARRLALDPKGKRLAVQLSDRSLAVYAWPRLEVELRIEYMERLVHGLAFGAGNWLGIALDHGDGNKIDVVTSATHRTDTHPGRTHRSWMLSVRGKEAVLSAKEVDDIRRMKDPFHIPAPERAPGNHGSNNNNGARVGIGLAISLALLCLRLCASASRSSSYSSGAYEPYAAPTPTIPDPPRAIKHVALVRLEGPTLLVATEEIPAANPGEGEEPGAIWTAPDGTVFVSTMNVTHDRSHVHRRDKSGAWDVVARRRSSRAAQLWGRSGTDLYILDHDSLAHFDGTETTEVTVPIRRTLALGGIGEDVFVAGLSPAADASDVLYEPKLQRQKGSSKPWTPEPVGDGIAVDMLWSGGGTLWARATGKDGGRGVDDLLLQRSTSGRWTERKWFGATRPTTTSIHAVWVSPTGDTFVATGEGIFRSSSAGAAWSKSDVATNIEALWGRSSADVYAATDDGLLHFDGKSWSPTSYTERVSVVGGTATDVLLTVAAD